jgi:hypothetical protein
VRHDKLPAYVVLGGDRFKVVECPEILDEDGNCLSGRINFDQHLIEIEAGLPDGTRQRHLWHEVCHFYLCWYGLGRMLRTHLKGKVADEVEEAICDLVGSLVWETFEGNKGRGGRRGGQKPRQNSEDA